MKRSEHNPILEPIRQHSWESKLVYNAAAFRAGAATYLLYRAMGEDQISRLGLAWSHDGIQFGYRLPHPIFGPVEEYERPSKESLQSRTREKGGCEDPRVTIVRDRIYMVYTAYGDLCQSALASMALDRFLGLVEARASRETWNQSWQRHGLLFPQLPGQGILSRNACLFALQPEGQQERYGLLHRIGMGPVCISYATTPTGPWSEGQIFLQAEQVWERDRIGICTPPIATSRGQLFFYHGVEPTVKGGRVYRLGCLFANFSGNGVGTVSHVVARSRRPVLSPEREYERRSDWLEPLGVYAIFSCGAVPCRPAGICDDDDEILLYYSGGDTRLNVLSATVSELAQQVWGRA